MRTVSEISNDTELKERYDFACCKCGHEMQFAPCIIMQMGVNSGHGRCSKCGEFLALHIEGDAGWSELYSDHVERIKSEKSDSRNSPT